MNCRPGIDNRGGQLVKKFFDKLHKFYKLS